MIQPGLQSAKKAAENIHSLRLKNVRVKKLEN